MMGNRVENDIDMEESDLKAGEYDDCFEDDVEKWKWTDDLKIVPQSCCTNKLLGEEKRDFFERMMIMKKRIVDAMMEATLYAKVRSCLAVGDIERESSEEKELAAKVQLKEKHTIADKEMRKAMKFRGDFSGELITAAEHASNILRKAREIHYEMMNSETEINELLERHEISVELQKQWTRKMACNANERECGLDEKALSRNPECLYTELNGIRVQQKRNYCH